jgi:hypothetical protein
VVIPKRMQQAAGFVLFALFLIGFGAALWSASNKPPHDFHRVLRSTVAIAAPDAAGKSVCDRYIFNICFVTPPPVDGPLFGFAQFITALALLLLVYTLSDVRYRFRIAVAPIPLRRLTFGFLIIIGLGTLLTNIWFAERWPVPNVVASLPLWQGSFGFAFFMLVVTWIWYAFINPPSFSKRNPQKFAQELYSKILQGSDSDLPVIADELARSAESIVRAFNHCPANGERKHRVSSFANDVMLMIGNRKLCRHIVSSSPGTAMAFFDEMSKQKKYRLPLGQFAVNISTEALINRDSIIYHEDEGYYSGFFGYVRPFSNTVYGNYAMVEAMAHSGRCPLDISHELASSWDATQARAYSRLVLITLKDYLDTGNWGAHSFALYRALDRVQRSRHDIYTLDGASTVYNTDAYQRLVAVVEFVKDAIDLLDKYDNLKTVLRKRGDNRLFRDNFYDYIANMMFEIIFAASAVAGPADTCWSIQHNVVWGGFFNTHEGSAWHIVRFKLRRLLYNEIRKLETQPNYKSSRIFGFCLNILGFAPYDKTAFFKQRYALSRVMRNWAKSNYLKLRNAQPEVAASCLLGSVSFEPENGRLVKTYFKGLNLEAPREYLELSQPAK